MLERTNREIFWVFRTVLVLISLHRRRNIMLVHNVCKLVHKSLFKTPNEVNKIPQVVLKSFSMTDQHDSRRVPMNLFATRYIPRSFNQFCFWYIFSGFSWAWRTCRWWSRAILDVACFRLWSQSHIWSFSENCTMNACGMARLLFSFKFDIWTRLFCD